MPNSKQIVYLSQAQYAELIANGSITVDGVTVTYDENDIYVTPQAKPVTDVRVAGTSVTSNGVANIPVMSSSNFGVAKVGDFGVGIGTGGLSNYLVTVPASSTYIKRADNGNYCVYRPISPRYQHESVYYGLAKAAGADMANVTGETVGTYPDEQKSAIQQMLGVSDLLAPRETSYIASQAYAVGDIFTLNGKLYKVTTAIAESGAIVVQGDGETVSGANAVQCRVEDGFVKKTNYATNSVPGIVKTNPAYGTQMFGDVIATSPCNDNYIKLGTHQYNPIVSATQHKSVFYGLAKAAGDTTQSQSSNAVGTYTTEAKTAIRSMIGAENGDDLIKVQDTQPTAAATKIWLPETAPAGVDVPTVAEMNIALAGKVGDVQVNGTSVVSNRVANVSVATDTSIGVVQTGGGYGLSMSGKYIRTVKAPDSVIPIGTDNCRPIVPANQHNSVFYGLAKAAGDATQSASANAVGAYTDEAKAAIKGMIGVNVDDVQVNGTSVVTDGVANVPLASSSAHGVVRVRVGDNGLSVDSSGYLYTYPASSSDIKNGYQSYRQPAVNRQHESVFYGLAKASGDTTQSTSSNAVGTYTDNAKASIKAMLGIVDGSTSTVSITGTTPSITAVENTRYTCGEVSTLTITPPASGICIIRFTSGTTPTVLTATGVVWPAWFDATDLDANTTYEICITDGYGAVMSWAL